MTTDPRTTLPWQLVARFGVPFGYERSFRLGPNSLLTDRFLLSVSLASLGPKAPEKVRELSAALAMPDHLRAPMERALVRTRFLHLGYEAGPSTRVYKIYLESGLRDSGPSATVLLHEAFKWDAARSGPGVVARYVWHVGLSIDGMRERIAAIYGDRREALEVATSVVDLAASWAGPDEVRYLDVTEDRSPRRSFDLNLYDAGLCVRDLSPQLTRIRKRYDIAPDRFATLYERVHDLKLGHVAGGVHRAGEDFFTIYYGVEEGRIDA